MDVLMIPDPDPASPEIPHYRKECDDVSKVSSMEKSCSHAGLLIVETAKSIMKFTVRRTSGLGDMVQCCAVAQRLTEMGHESMMVFGDGGQWLQSHINTDTPDTSPSCMLNMDWMEFAFDVNQIPIWEVARLCANRQLFEHSILIPQENFKPRITPPVYMPRPNCMRDGVNVGYAIRSSFHNRSLMNGMIPGEMPDVSWNRVWIDKSQAPKGFSDTGEMNTVDLINLIGRLDAIVCVDSGISHIAQACGTPVIGIEASGKHHLRFHPQSDHIALREVNGHAYRPDMWGVIERAVHDRLNPVKVSALIPTLRGGPALAATVASVYDQVDQIVISVDGGPVYLNQIEDPNGKVTVVPSISGVQGGYGATCLKGFPYCRHGRILLLNDDCHATRGSVATMNVRLKPGVGAVGCRIDNQDGSLWHGAHSMLKWPMFAHIDDVRGIQKITETSSVDAVTFCMALIDRGAFFKSGSFDQNLFAYCEDVDSCLSMRSNGWVVLYEPDAIAVHVGSSSSSPDEKTEWISKSVSYMNRKWPHQCLPAITEAPVQV